MNFKEYQKLAQRSVITNKDPLMNKTIWVLWYLAAFSESLGLSLQEIAESNVEKVMSRKARGVTKGKGDNR